LVVATLPKTSHPKIVYPGAVTRNAQNPAEARAFLTWLKSRQAQAVFLKNGFSPLD
jgi:ABC-type molybdate transport system substrate-binding protein